VSAINVRYGGNKMITANVIIVVCVIIIGVKLIRGDGE